MFCFLGALLTMAMSYTIVPVFDADQLAIGVMVAAGGMAGISLYQRLVAAGTMAALLRRLGWRAQGKKEDNEGAETAANTRDVDQDSSGNRSVDHRRQHELV